ncbi:hypothetical protein TB2_018243 [Malus domestica]
MTLAIEVSTLAIRRYEKEFGSRNYRFTVGKVEFIAIAAQYFGFARPLKKHPREILTKKIRLYISLYYFSIISRSGIFPSTFLVEQQGINMQKHGDTARSWGHPAKASFPSIILSKERKAVGTEKQEKRKKRSENG